MRARPGRLLLPLLLAGTLALPSGWMARATAAWLEPDPTFREAQLDSGSRCATP